RASGADADTFARTATHRANAAAALARVDAGIAGRLTGWHDALHVVADFDFRASATIQRATTTIRYRSTLRTVVVTRERLTLHTALAEHATAAAGLWSLAAAAV